MDRPLGIGAGRQASFAWVNQRGNCAEVAKPYNECQVFGPYLAVDCGVCNAETQDRQSHEGLSSQDLAYICFLTRNRVCGAAEEGLVTA